MSIASIVVQPWPEGPPIAVGADHGSPYPAALQTAFEHARTMIGTELPLPVRQTCCPSGTIVHLALSDGQTATYGPCDRPTAIESARQAIVDASGSTAPATT